MRNLDRAIRLWTAPGRVTIGAMRNIPVDDGPALSQGLPVAGGGDPPASREVLHELAGGDAHVEGVYERDPFPQADPPWAYRWVEQHDCWRTTGGGRYRIADA
jgi:hypothetical protein